jgi:hypothetical protein
MSGWAELLMKTELVTEGVVRNTRASSHTQNSRNEG